MFAHLYGVVHHTDSLASIFFEPLRGTVSFRIRKNMSDFKFENESILCFLNNVYTYRYKKIIE